MGDSSSTGTADRELTEQTWLTRAGRHPSLRRLGKIGLFLISLFLFILAIMLMKEGAGDLAPLVRDRFRVSNPVNSLGFGWLFAYVIMSGSPVAAAALAFFNAGVIDQISTYTMITGSRLGAGFIVLFIGFIYVLRGRSRVTSLSMGILSLSVSGTSYLLALPLGLFLLRNQQVAALRFEFSPGLSSTINRLFDPFISFLLAFLPRWSLFLVGLGIILVSFNLFDKCLPEMSLKESQIGRMSRLVYKPWVMFLLGAGITMISMSVSLSLSILLPLSHRGFVRRENVIPYIMGANITTFIDTLLAAVLLQDPAAFTVVLAGMLAITLVSVVILAFFFRLFERAMLAVVNQVIESDRSLILYMGIILIVPLFLLLL